uniref:mechanosensitive ion channel protein 1, mitochondrial-like n=1 Tax=Erigeron canadensis TaxID=72917 RepID=UPI001CB95B82|nr:mechanosensitive ion channel protein 1, mitochondrial-like [Erigeron canadensis]
MTSGIRLLFSTAKTSSSRMMTCNTIPKPNNVNQVVAKLRPCFSSVGRQYLTNRSNNMNVVPPRMSNLSLESSYPFLGLGTACLLNRRLFSSSAGGSRGENVASSGASSTNGVDGNDLIHKVKEVWESGVNIVSQTGEKAKEALGEASPHVEQLLETHPYLRDVIVPVSGTLAGTVAAWAILPTVFRRFHKYSEQGPGSLVPAGSLWGAVPYEKSLWGALEVPVKYLITFMAFSQIGAMVAPTTIALQSLGPVWKAAVVLSFVWFLHRWKTNVVSRALVLKSGADRDKLMALDNFSSVGLFVISGMVLAEASGVAMQTVWTVGGIGGIATAYAAKDVLGNVLSGLSIQASQPFSIGDTIKAGAVEGQVKEMGLTTTSLLSAEQHLIVVPNSLFSGQAIVNKSRVGWRAMVSTIPVQIDDFDKIPLISEEIENMMKANANVFLEKDQPYCYLSRVERSFAELSLGYNLKQMNKNKLFAAQQDLILQSAGIIKKHGGMLARTWET